MSHYCSARTKDAYLRKSPFLTLLNGVWKFEKVIIVLYQLINNNDTFVII